MSLTAKKIFYGIALTTAAIVFWGCSQPVDPPADITWTAAADGAGGATTSTKIDVTFAGSVTDLIADQITLTNGTGTVTRGALTGNGTNWSLGLTVETAGDITLAIDKAGIESGAKTVTVHKQITVPAPVSYTVTADGASGATTSTKIDFVFNAAIEGLTAEQITLTNGTGTVTKGDLAGSGANWSLGLTVDSAGNITVAVNKPGIASGAKTLTVHKQGETPPVPYTVTTDGESGAATSTKIDFVFNAAVEGLTAEQITLTNGTGAVTKGDLTGSGINWSLEIVVDGAGDISVTIDKPGIESGAKPLTVHKAPVVTDTVKLLQGEGYEWATGIISGEGAAQTMTLVVVEEPLAYFAIEKTAAQTVAVSNDGGNKVIQAEEGDTLDSGETASDTVALFSVNMEDLLFDGAFGESGAFNADAIPAGTETRSFTLTVTEDDKEPRIITVNLNITLDQDTETSIYHRGGEPGAYYYVKVRDAELPTTDIVNASFVAFNEGEVTDLQNAFVWVDHYGEEGANNAGFADGTTEGYSEYRLFVKKSQKIGLLGLKANARSNISIELYGAGILGTKEQKIVINPSFLTERTQMLNLGPANTNNGFLITLVPDVALVLGKNITIDAQGTIEDQAYQFSAVAGHTSLYKTLQVYYLIIINSANSMFIMNDGSKLTGIYVGANNPGNSSYCPVYANGGKFIMNRGAMITENLVGKGVIRAIEANAVLNEGSIITNNFSVVDGKTQKNDRFW